MTHSDGPRLTLEIPLIVGPCVYEFWDADGNPLYVGWAGAQQLIRRIGDHALDNGHRVKWWKDVAQFKFDQFADNETAQTEERRRIYLLRPLHNKVYNCGHDWSLPENYDPRWQCCRICLREQTRAQAGRRKAVRTANKTARITRTNARRLTRGAEWREAGRQPEWDEQRRHRAERRAAITAFVAERPGTMTGAELARLIAEKFGGNSRSHQARLYEGAYGPHMKDEPQTG